jgi:hypothetical protein
LFPKRTVGKHTRYAWSFSPSVLVSGPSGLPISTPPSLGRTVRFGCTRRSSAAPSPKILLRMPSSVKIPSSTEKMVSENKPPCGGGAAAARWALEHREEHFCFGGIPTSIRVASFRWKGLTHSTSRYLSSSCRPFLCYFVVRGCYCDRTNGPCVERGTLG